MNEIEKNTLIKEQIAKFRYNWKLFNTMMEEYERAIEMTAKGRNNAHSDLINGFKSNKWEKFIKDKELESESKLNQAVEAFQLMKSFLVPEPRKRPAKKRKR